MMLICPFVGGEIMAALEIDRVDFLYRDEFPHVDAAVRFGFERFQLGIFNPSGTALWKPRSLAPFRRAR
jgi:hypothetical protein